MESNLEGSFPVLFPTIEDTGQGTAHYKDLFIVPTLLPLSTILQGGDSDFSWLGFPLKFFFAHAKVGTGDMGQPLQITLRLLSQRAS